MRVAGKRIVTVPALAVLAAAGALAAGAVGPAGAQQGVPALTVGVDPVSASIDEVTYRIVVANRGTVGADGVTVTNQVPSNTTFASSVPPPSAAAQGGAPSCGAGSAALTECRWAIGHMTAGSSVVIDVTLTLTPLSGSSYGVTSVVNATGSGGLTASDTDDTIVKSRQSLEDTYVDDRAAANTYNASCQTLRMRRDDSMSAFVRAGIPGEVERVDRVWSARIEAKVQSGDPAAPSTQLGLHRIDPGAWSAPASGTCGNLSAVGYRPRTGSTPTSAATPTSVAAFSGVPGSTIRWDVTADLDSYAERYQNEGWEVLDEGTTPAGAESALHSSEATVAGDRPRLFIVYSTLEPPTCIEVLPRAQTQTSPHEAVVAARLTDGAPAQVSEVCNGATTPGERVEFVVTDDDPDVYVSSANGRPSVYSGNTRVASVDPDTGVATAGLRLYAPEYGEGPIGDTSVRARYAENCSPAKPGGPARCTTTPPTTEFNVHWERGPAPATPPPPPPPPPPEGGGEDAGEDAPQTQPSARTVSATASSARTRWGNPVTVAGRLASPAAACLDEQAVQLWRRYPGRAWEAVARQRSSEGGDFQLEVLVSRTAEYVAVAEGTPACLGATSDELTVRSRPFVELNASRFAPRAGSRVVLRGSVMPRAQGRHVVVEQRARRGWRRVGRAKLDRKSRFRLPVRVSWSGERRFRARVKRTAAHSAGVSGTIAIVARARRRSADA